MNIIGENEVFKALKLLGKYPYAKIKNESVNIHEEVVMNLFKRCNQYQLLNRLLKEGIENNKICFYSNMVYTVQIWSEIKRKELIMSSQDDKMICYTEQKKTGKELTKNIKDATYSMKNSGDELRKAIMFSKGVSSGECLRGIEYQLLNALSVRNTEKFMDIVLRLYSAYAYSLKKEKPLSIPNGLVNMLNDKEKFTRYGYAFVMGLEGCYEVKKSDNNKEENDTLEGGN